MPALLTHYLYSKNYLKNENNKYLPLTLLASQGPDIYFFNTFLTKHSIISSFGTLLHHINISEAYTYLINYSNKDEFSEDTKLILKAFIKGLFMHYSLDRVVHPYVFYRTLYDFEIIDKKYYFKTHTAFETTMDLLIKNIYEPSIKVPTIALKCNKKNVKLCSTMMYHLANDIFHNNNIKDNTYYKSYKGMKFLYHVFSSRFGIKKKLFGLLSKNQGFVFSLIMPKKSKYEQSVDFLNLKHQEWKNPQNGDVSSESVLDLFERASKDIKTINHLVYDLKNKEQILSETSMYINNIDHDGSIIAQGDKKYYKCAWLDVVKK